ncbi:universal stress protein E [Pseudomonas sp. JUb42]|uniref:universal stress protein n=1 Tax=Pseudomonas sp. JUb42 TaxID=2940611 RepID=UPI00216A1C3B|nr:universal stress protein [Pseudomonas sp. JUb42]MCS3471577.1 universal stress protein E [Pseudomonas sp. JUb42]
MYEQPRFMLIASSQLQTSAILDRAAALATAHDAALHIVAFDYLEGLATADLVSEQVREVMRANYLERHRDWLEQHASLLREQGLSVTTEVIWVDNPLDEILIHLQEQPMTALIKPIEYQSQLSRLFFTPLDIQLLRKCPTPLHFVSDVKHALPRRILAAVDPFHRDGRYQDFNDRILHEAVKLATACDATIHVLYAHDLSSISAQEFGFDNGSPFFSSKGARSLFDAQCDAFTELAERNRIPPEQRHMILGAPTSVLCSYASAYDIDVIVMGRIGHGDQGHLIGNTVESLLHKMPCSLWVLAPQPMD